MPSRESQTNQQRIDVAGPTALGDAVKATRRFALDQGLADRDQARLCIVVEELITNLCEHGICDTAHEIGVELERQPTAIGIVIEDNSGPFDPRTAKAAPTMPDRGGGTGLPLVKAWAEILGYEIRNGRNRLELKLPLERT